MFSQTTTSLETTATQKKVSLTDLESRGDVKGGPGPAVVYALSLVGAAAIGGAAGAVAGAAIGYALYGPKSSDESEGNQAPAEGDGGNEGGGKRK